METLLFDTASATPEALKAQVERETARWTALIQQAGISPE
jgi:tripartite-type tricarboxylate transporter receptor subunit TctC